MGVTVLPEGTAEGARVQGGKQAFTSQSQSDWVRPTDWPALADVKATDSKFSGLVAVTNDNANFLAFSFQTGNNVPAFANIDYGSSSTDAATYTTSSNTLTAGSTYILCVENSHGTDASAVSSITSATAGVPTFTVRATTQFNGTLNRVTILTATPTVAWTGALTINFGGTTQTGVCWVIDRADGVANLTSDGVLQTATATGTSGTASVTLSTLTSGSATYGVQGHASTAASTAGTGYTELADVTTATPAQAIQTERNLTGSTTVNATFTSAAWGMIGVEFKAVGVTVDWGDGTTSSYTGNASAYKQFTYSTLTTPVTSGGYKTAVVTATPTGMFTTFGLNVKHNQARLPAYTSGWLDVVFSGPAATAVTIGNQTPQARLDYLTQVRILSSSITDYSSQFYNCTSLRSFSLSSQRNVTSAVSMFQNCRALTRVPTFTTSSVTSLANIFNGCTSLQIVPTLTTTAVTTMSSAFDNCPSLRVIGALDCTSVTTAPTLGQPSMASVVLTGLTRGVDVGSTSMSQGAIETLMDSLGKASGAQTFTIGTVWGAPAAISKASSGTTSGSTTVTISDTSSLATGMEISGTGISDAVAVTFQDAGDTVTRTAHGIPNDTPVSFASITSTTGIATYTTYYVVNATADTFQVSDTVGGSAKALTTDGSGTCLYGTTITSITANTSIELSIPASATGSVTTSSALLKRSKARLKGFTVSG